MPYRLPRLRGLDEDTGFEGDFDDFEPEDEEEEPVLDRLRRHRQEQADVEAQREQMLAQEQEAQFGVPSLETIRQRRVQGQADDDLAFEESLTGLPPREQQRQRRLRSQQLQERQATTAAQEAEITSPFALAARAYGTEVPVVSPFLREEVRPRVGQAGRTLAELGARTATGGPVADIAETAGIEIPLRRRIRELAGAGGQFAGEAITPVSGFDIALSAIPAGAGAKAGLRAGETLPRAVVRGVLEGIALDPTRPGAVAQIADTTPRVLRVAVQPEAIAPYAEEGLAAARGAQQIIDPSRVRILTEGEDLAPGEIALFHGTAGALRGEGLDVGTFLTPSQADAERYAGVSARLLEAVQAGGSPLQVARRALAQGEAGAVKIGGKTKAPPPPPPPLEPPSGGGGGVPPVARRPLPELGDSGVKAALAAKEEATLQTGRFFGEQGSIQRRVVGAINPSVDMPREVHVANQARSAVVATERTALSQAEVPAYRKLQQTFEASPPAYVGPEGRPLANTWVDYAENPRLYEASPELTAAKEELRAAQDGVIARVRSEYGVDVKPFQGADPEGVYIPHMQSRDSLDEAVQRTEASLSSRSSIAKERAYDSLSDRVARDPKFEPELDATTLADIHSSSLASMAANNTFKAGSGGKTKIEVMNEVHPGLRSAYDSAKSDVDKLRGRIETALSREGQAAGGARVSEAAAEAVEKKMALLEARIELLGEEYGPELSFLSGQLRELRLQAAGLERRGAGLAERASELGEYRGALQADLDAAQGKVAELAKRYRTASTGDYVMNRKTFRYYDPKTSEAIDSITKTGFNNAFIDGAISLGNNARALGLGPDFSPVLGVQGALGALSHPEVAIRDGAAILRAAFSSKEELVKMIGPERLRRFEFANNRSLGSLSEEVVGRTKIAGREIQLPGRPIQKFNEALYRAVDFGTLRAWENDSHLLQRFGESANVADHEAANSLSKVIPRLINQETGRSVQRVKLEGALPTSRSFTAAPFELAKDFASAHAKVVTGKAGGLLGREKLALLRGYTFIGSALGISAASALASAPANGKDPIEAVKEVIDPGSSRFMSIIVGDEGSFSIGGPLRSAFLGAYRTATRGPEGGYRYATGRLQPVVGAAEDVMTNRDWRGRPVREGSPWNQVLQSVQHIARSANILAGGVVEGYEEGGVTGLAEQAVSGAVGVNYYERGLTDVRDRLAQKRYGKPYADLLTSEQEAIDKEPIVQEKRSEPTEYAQNRDRRAAEREAAIAEKVKAWEEGQLSTKTLPENLTDIKAAFYQSLADLRKDNEKAFKNLPDRKHQATLDGFFSDDLTVKNKDGSINWEPTIVKRERYIAELPEPERVWLEDYIGVQAEKKLPIEKDLTAYNDKREELGYFKEGLTQTEKAALDKANPDVDVQTWRYYGGFEDKAEHPDPVLQTPAAVNQALALQLPNRNVRLDGLDRPINQDENSLKAWQSQQKMLNWYYNELTSESERDKKALRLYGKTYDVLSTSQQGSVNGNLHEAAWLKYPELDAALYWWGATSKVHSKAAQAALDQMLKEYGTKSPKVR